MTRERRERIFALAARGDADRLSALRGVVVHHSATSRSSSFEALESGHVARGYACVGYHALVMGDASLRIGRPLPIAGAHAPGRNADTIGLCIVGDNTAPEHRWLPTQLETARAFLAALELIAPGLELIAHRDVKATACPGMTRAELHALLVR